MGFRYGSEVGEHLYGVGAAEAWHDPGGIAFGDAEVIPGAMRAAVRVLAVEGLPGCLVGLGANCDPPACLGGGLEADRIGT